MPKKARQPENVVTVERINALVDAIVPPSGCSGESSEVVALALNELIMTLTSPETKYAPAESADWFAYFAARRAFERAPGFDAALEGWRANAFETAR